MKPYLLLLSLLPLLVLTVSAQISQEEHLSHHPEEAAKAKEGAKKGAKEGMGDKKGGGMGDMMGDMMGGMMKKMGVPPKKDLYPELMDLADLSLKKRKEFENSALLRMIDSTHGMLQSIEKLKTASQNDNLKLMQNATEDLRVSLSEFESGLSTRRALKEGKAPKNVALKWFRKEMNLSSSLPVERKGGLFGITWFHFFVMFFLIAAFLAFLFMYFFKMRRAGQLIKVLDTVSPATTETVTETSNETPANDVSQKASNKFSGQLKIVSIFEETDNVKTFRMTDSESGVLPFSFLAGQFLTLKVNVEGKQVSRSYTIASSPSHNKYCELTIKRENEGCVSKYLSDQMKVGDLLEVKAPLGKFVFTGKESDSIALLSGGVGITPMMSVARYLLDSAWGKPIYFIHICKTMKDLIFADELKYLESRHENFHLVLSMTREDTGIWKGEIGRLSEAILRSAIPDIQKIRYHICGPDPMMKASQELLLSLKIDSNNIKMESFGGSKKSPPKVAKESVEQGSFKVNFIKSGKSHEIDSNSTVLDLADEIGVEIDNSCRDGSCGTCLVKLNSGKVSMACDDGLEDTDKEKGFVLACQAKAQSDLEVET